jgi:hypothetical protein
MLFRSIRTVVSIRMYPSVCCFVPYEPDIIPTHGHALLQQGDPNSSSTRTSASHTHTPSVVASDTGTGHTHTPSFASDTDTSHARESGTRQRIEEGGSCSHEHIGSNQANNAPGLVAHVGDTDSTREQVPKLSGQNESELFPVPGETGTSMANELFNATQQHQTTQNSQNSKESAGTMGEHTVESDSKFAGDLQVLFNSGIIRVVNSFSIFFFFN